MGAALTETSLEQLIESRFLHTEPDLIGRIFLNRGPLSDFDSKILIAHAFGIITGPLADQLHSIKAIRNAFAHTDRPLSFENEIVTREVDTFPMAEAFIRYGQQKKILPRETIGSKRLFLLMAIITIAILSGIRKRPSLTGREALGKMLPALRRKYGIPSPPRSRSAGRSRTGSGSRPRSSRG